MCKTKLHFLPCKAEVTGLIQPKISCVVFYVLLGNLQELLGRLIGSLLW